MVFEVRQGGYILVQNSLFAYFVFRGESPGCHLFGTASMLEWLRNLLPRHHSQGSSTERWSRNTLRVVTARVLTSSGGLKRPHLFLIIQWRRQRQFTW